MAQPIRGGSAGSLGKRPVDLVRAGQAIQEEPGRGNHTFGSPWPAHVEDVLDQVSADRKRGLCRLYTSTVGVHDESFAQKLDRLVAMYRSTSYDASLDEL